MCTWTTAGMRMAKWIDSVRSSYAQNVFRFAVATCVSASYIQCERQRDFATFLFGCRTSRRRRRRKCVRSFRFRSSCESVCWTVDVRRTQTSLSCAYAWHDVRCVLVYIHKNTIHFCRMTEAEEKPKMFGRLTSLIPNHLERNTCIRWWFSFRHKWVNARDISIHPFIDPF